MKRVLVTGAAGFIGRHTLRPLLASGYEVHAVSSRAVGGATTEPDLHWHHTDLLAPEGPERLVRAVEPTHLLHLAWYTLTGAFWTAPVNLEWVDASLRLLRAFGECAGRRAVLAGTCTEYAWERLTHCIEERPVPARDRAREEVTAFAAWGRYPTRVCPATLYGAAKHALHVVAERWTEQSEVELAWGRVFHAYGPHEHPARLVSGVASALLSGKEALCTSGRQIRDYSYTPELGGAFASLLASGVTGPVNMASGEPVRVADLVMAVALAAGRPELVRLGALAQRPGEPERLTADVRRLREEVGWSPSITLEDGIVRTVEWWKHSLRQGDDERLDSSSSETLKLPILTG
ncbi:MAG TPA: NAD(P)-dependent oxidoreductase [Solirubrobacteraceae bacterium]|jgi:nucleoside-diphosphate-sugar epimerase|nr:NAD(P)-dependent oxidoreductase [Solirubrobacteraceae bacterium]